MKQHGTEKERYYHTASAHHRHDTYHGIRETEGIEIYEICRTEEDADEDDILELAEDMAELDENKDNLEFCEFIDACIADVKDVEK